MLYFRLCRYRCRVMPVPPPILSKAIPVRAASDELTFSIAMTLFPGQVVQGRGFRALPTIRVAPVPSRPLAQVKILDFIDIIDICFRHLFSMFEWCFFFACYPFYSLAVDDDLFRPPLNFCFICLRDSCRSLTLIYRSRPSMRLTAKTTSSFRTAGSSMPGKQRQEAEMTWVTRGCRHVAV